MRFVQYILLVCLLALLGLYQNCAPQISLVSTQSSKVGDDDGGDGGAGTTDSNSSQWVEKVLKGRDDTALDSNTYISIQHMSKDGEGNMVLGVEIFSFHQEATSWGILTLDEQGSRLSFYPKTPPSGQSEIMNFMFMDSLDNIYVSVRNTYFPNTGEVLGYKLLKSSDGGNNFTEVFIPPIDKRNINFNGISPTGEIYISSGYKLYWSDDAGDTWTEEDYDPEYKYSFSDTKVLFDQANPFFVIGQALMDDGSGTYIQSVLVNEYDNQSDSSRLIFNGASEGAPRFSSKLFVDMNSRGEILSLAQKKEGEINTTHQVKRDLSGVWSHSTFLNPDLNRIYDLGSDKNNNFWVAKVKDNDVIELVLTNDFGQTWQIHQEITTPRYRSPKLYKDPSGELWMYSNTDTFEYRIWKLDFQ